MYIATRNTVAVLRDVLQYRARSVTHSSTGLCGV